MRCQLLRPAVALLTFSASVFVAENFNFVLALVAAFARGFIFAVTPFTLSGFCFFITMNTTPGKLKLSDRLNVYMLRFIALLLFLAGLLAVAQSLRYTF